MNKRTNLLGLTSQTLVRQCLYSCHQPPIPNYGEEKLVLNYQRPLEQFRNSECIWSQWTNCY